MEVEILSDIDMSGLNPTVTIGFKDSPGWVNAPICMVKTDECGGDTWAAIRNAGTPKQSKTE
jgi:hypothetical protein